MTRDRSSDPANDHADDHTHDRIDWSQLWFPGPTRSFTVDELARAGAGRPSRTFTAMACFNLALTAFVVLQVAPVAATPALTLLLAITSVVAVVGAQRLWRQPTRRALAVLTVVGLIAVMAALAAAITWQALPSGSAERDWVRGVGSVSAIALCFGWWFVAVYRSHQIEARLRELAERDRAIAMARRLGAAQLQPHFLFNSLASLQHWVQAQDTRAAPMLQALTSFLRATLPLFDRDWLSIGDEAEAARRYLEVMRLRLGERLRVRVDIAADAAAVAIPPGIVLTLVENAVEHGVMPSLSGAEVALCARVVAGRAIVEVHDGGPGPSPDASDGVGLANVRARLAQAFGADARLNLQAAADGGCTARIDWPLTPVPAASAAAR